MKLIFKSQCIGDPISKLRHREVTVKMVKDLEREIMEGRIKGPTNEECLTSSSSSSSERERERSSKSKKIKAKMNMQSTPRGI